jgi:hypothetical protein
MTPEIQIQTTKADGVEMRFASRCAWKDRPDAYGQAALAWLDGGCARSGDDR